MAEIIRSLKLINSTESYSRYDNNHHVQTLSYVNHCVFSLRTSIETLLIAKYRS